MEQTTTVSLGFSGFADSISGRIDASGDVFLGIVPSIVSDQIWFTLFSGC